MNKLNIMDLVKFKADNKTKQVIFANFLMALVSIVIGGIAAIFIAIGRSGISELFSLLNINHEYYYRWLTLHGMNMLIFWILWFEVALLYFTSTVILNQSIHGYKIALTSLTTMLYGQILVEYSILSGESDVLFTAYPPLAADNLFYAGYILFLLGTGVAVILFFVNIYKAKVNETYKGSLPLVTWGAAIAGIIAITAIFQGIIILTNTLAWKIGLISINPMTYRWFFWGLGHNAQYVNVVATIAVLYALIVLGTGFKTINFINERYAKLAFALVTLFVIPGIGHHILVDPGFSTILKQASGSVGSHFLSVPTMLHAFALLGALEATLRSSGHTSLLGWIRKIPWKNPAMATIVLVLISFGIGGITAQPLTTLQPNLNYHNTFWVPGHFHFMVAGGTTLAFMTLIYYMLPILISKRIYSIKLVTIQIYLFFLGILILGLSMIMLGYEGVPRRTLINSSLLPSWSISPLILVGGTLAITAGIMFVLNVLLTILLGKQGENIFEGFITNYDIKETSNVSKKGSLVVCFIVIVILLLIFFISFVRLTYMPSLY
jgi:Heme/copper-type cytochrome/quinol oxidases, subunit 1